MLTGLVICGLGIGVDFLIVAVQAAFCTVVRRGVEVVPKDGLFSCFLPRLDSNCRKAVTRSKGGQEQEISRSREKRERKLEQNGKRRLEN